jgi:predicted Zn-dependent protease
VTPHHHLVGGRRGVQVSQRWVLNLGQLLLMAVVGPGVIPELASMVGMLGLELPFSRKCESEADSMGLTLMSRACFDPRCDSSARSLTVPTERPEP